MSIYEIPLQSATPQKFSVPINGVTYSLSFQFCDAPDGGWLMNIADTYGTSLANGIPLVTGVDLLEQYAHLGFGFKMFVLTDGAPAACPTWGNLGSTSHVYVEF